MGTNVPVTHVLSDGSMNSEHAFAQGVTNVPVEPSSSPRSMLAEDAFLSRRRLEDLNAPHPPFAFVPILMILMLVYFVQRKSAQKWNSFSFSRSEVQRPAVRERSARRHD